ncbi:uncharacterized protein LOC112468370 [Temnothorax curvispinosus]|uniref:Uncharacterized protein LOC112468370 n=1 Tax=Temnothorax curvispinosus TaxID=300111 RepID=A0A6J1RKR4_9HYME|nr:uncharacterized protein LOC112468370 [Temnothorax curvispinosus]
MFDALNRKLPNQGLTPECNDFKVLEDSLQWLNNWETAMMKKEIKPNEFLTTTTSRGLRITLQSTLHMCRYLIEKFNFDYLLTGKVNQDNLEKFIGTIRQSAGCNDHPNCPTFLQLYKLLSVYSVIKPPKFSNCTVFEDRLSSNLIKISDLKAVFGKKGEAKSSMYLREIQKKLDTVLEYEDWDADDLIEDNDPITAHDYDLYPLF